MPENFERKFPHIDDLLSEVEESTNPVRLFADIDDLCGEIDNALDSRKQEVLGWPIERKRKEATDSSDQYALNLLSMDENFTIRTLSACNSAIPSNSLRRLVENTNDYIRMVIANNPTSTSDILDRIAELSEEQEVIDAVKAHPNISTITKFKIENKM